MIIISYDISNDKLRSKFSKTLEKHGAIRLQNSVYEVNNTNRTIDNLKILVETKFSPLFDGEDSVVVMKVDDSTMTKYGNAVHRDKDVLYF